MATYNVNRLAGFLSIAEVATIDVLNRGETSFEHDLTQILAGIQADRKEALTQVRELQLAMQLLLDAESQRIATRDPSDARIPAFAHGANLAIMRAELMDHALVIADNRKSAARTEAIVHGRVTDESDGVAGPVTVSLIDEKGKPVDGVASVKADSAGYYALVIPPEVAARLPDAAPLTLAIDHGAERVTPSTPAINLGAGIVKLQNVELDEDSLRKLRLREKGGIPKPKTSAKPVPKPSAKSVPKSSPKKAAKRPAKPSGGKLKN